jgi:tetratricopeptide (TPR) repeat protein
VDDYQELHALVTAGDIRAAELRAAELTAAGDDEAWTVLGDILDDIDVLAALAAYKNGAEQSGQWLSYGNALSRHGWHTEAIDAYTQALPDEPAIAHRNIGIVHFEDLDDPAGAEYHYRRAIAEGDAVSGRLLGEVLEDQDRPAEALEYLQAAASAGDPRALIPLGWAYRKLGRFEEAEQAYLSAYDMRLDEEAVYYLATTYSDQGKLDQAEATYRRALADGDKSVLLNLGDIVALRGDSHQAISLYRQAIAAGEKLAWNNLGVELEHIGKYGQARKAFSAGAQLGDALAAENLAKTREHRHRHY